MANRITTIFDFSERGQGLKKIKADVAQVDGSINKAKAGVKGLWAEFSNNRAAQAAVAGLAIKVGADAVKAASNLEESINAVTVSYGSAADEVIKLGETSAESFGLSQRAFNEFAVQFSAFADQIAAKDGRRVVDVVQEMTGRVADFASVMNIDVPEAARIFQSALAGEQEPIKRFGINLSAAAVEAHALEEGMAASKSEIDESIKVQARYSLLMEETNKVAGDFKNTQDGLANSSRTLTAQFEDMQAELGRQLLPMVAETTSSLSEMATTVGDVIDAIKRMGAQVPPEIMRVADAVEAMSLPMVAIKGPLDLAKAGLDAVGLSSEDTAFSLDEATKAAWQNRAANIKAGIESENAARAAENHARSLRENARETTYAADATDEMGLIHRQVTRVVDAASEAQRRFMQSIRHVRDEVGHLKREIDDRQAWLNLQVAIEGVIAQGIDMTEMTREQELAVLDLKNEVIDYAEKINLPDRVVTNIMAQIDQGGLDNVNTLLERLGNGVTVPLRLQAVNSVNDALKSRGVTARVTTDGNLRQFHDGGVVPGPRGSEQLAVLKAGETVLPTHKPGTVSMGGGGPTYNITVNASGEVVPERIVDAIKQFERRNGNRWRS